MKILFYNIEMDEIADTMYIIETNYEYQFINDCELLESLIIEENNDYMVICSAVILEDYYFLKLSSELRKQHIPILVIANTVTSEERYRMLSFGVTSILGSNHCNEEKIYKINQLEDLYYGELRSGNSLKMCLKQQNYIQDENFKVNLISRKVFFKSRAINLSNQQITILILFMLNPHRCFCRDEITCYLGVETRNERCVDHLLKDLRKSTNSSIFKTIRGHGYCYKPNILG